MITDVYQYWRAACAGKMGSVEPLPTIGANNGEDPQPGLWKVRLRKDAPVVLMQIWLVDAIDGGDAVGYWRDGLTLAGQIAGKPAGSQDIIDRWLFGEPATKAEAAHWGQHGRWPSDAPPLPPRTHNAPVDPFEALQLEADERVEQAQRWLHEHSPIGDQVACDMARNIQAELLAVAKRADAMHEVEKRPHLEAGRKVDAKYGFRAALADWAAKLRGAFEGWMAAEERRQREAAEAKFREERAAAEAERRRIEAERARKLADDPAAALTDPEPELPALPVAPDPVKVQAGGGVGRRSGLKDDWDIEFTDYKLAALLVIEDPDIAIMVGKVLKRRVRAAKGKGDWPGIKVTRVRRAA